MQNNLLDSRKESNMFNKATVSEADLLRKNQEESLDKISYQNLQIKNLSLLIEDLENDLDKKEKQLKWILTTLVALITFMFLYYLGGS